MIKKPKASLVSSRTDWNSASLMGGRAINTVAGFVIPNIFLFNNSVDGSNLYVVHLEASTSVAGQLGFGTLLGFGAGSLQTGNFGPFDPLAGTYPGQIYTFNSGVCIATHTAGSADGFNAPFSWKHDWPLAIVPSGYSFNVEATAGSQTLFAAFWWYNGA